MNQFSFAKHFKVKNQRNGNFFITFKKASYLRHLNRELTDIQYIEDLKKQKLTDKLWLLAKRILVNVFIVGLFGLAFYGYYQLNQLSVKEKNNTKDRYIIRLKLRVKELKT